LKPIFSVCKQKVWNFLHWLKFVACNPLYTQIPLLHENLDLYSDHEVVPRLEERVIHDSVSDTRRVFEEESAGLDNHLAADLQSSSTGETVIFLESLGMSDPECSQINTYKAQANGLRNMYMQSEPENPDLVFHHSKAAVPEYDNPALFPGMFPTLFPYGYGGFESNRTVKLSFDLQAKYLLDVENRDIRYHRSFLFVMFNILQRRTAHLHTYLLVHQDKFETVAQEITQIKHETVLQVAHRLEKEKMLQVISESERLVLRLLQHVQSISAKIPGSTASKVTSRNQIRGYMGLFGMPPLFFTCNPSGVHSPIFQVVFGDTSVDLWCASPKHHQIETITDAIIDVSNRASQKNQIIYHLFCSSWPLYGSEETLP
jgi:hypothetical protein